MSAEIVKDTSGNLRGLVDQEQFFKLFQLKIEQQKRFLKHRGLSFPSFSGMSIEDLNGLSNLISNEPEKIKLIRDDKGVILGFDIVENNQS